MASQSKESNMNYIPIQLIEEILLRLPAESLARFKSVCKAWLYLISDRSFMAAITKRKVTSSASFLTWTRNYFQKQKLSLLSISDNDNREIPCSIIEPDLPLFLRTTVADCSDVTVMHCNGLISMDYRFQWDLPPGKMILCNPTLKEFKYLPKVLHSRGWLIGAGFGYDSTTDDYKLVRIYKFGHPSKLDAYVYSLRSGWWKMKPIFDGISHIPVFEKKGVYCRDTHYWLPEGYEGSKEKLHVVLPTCTFLVAFDYSKEELRLIPLPESIGKISYRIAKWKESVVLFSITKDSETSLEFEMWVMADRLEGPDGDISWTKQLTIGPLNNICSPLVFWKDDEFLLISNDKQIVSYNLYTEKRRTVPYTLQAVRFLNDFESYEGSLVSMGRGNMLCR